MIKRKEIWRIMEANWCPMCGDFRVFEKISTGLPGIVAQKCTQCHLGLQGNYLEDGEDVLDHPEEWKLLSKDYCFVCQTNSDFDII